MSAASQVSPEFAAAFLAQADADGTMSFERFMAIALYDPVLGYYRQERSRVGYARGTDFYTASTSGSIFGELVSAACVALLGSESPSDFTFVEIGAETAAGVLAGVSHPFGAARTLRVGDRLEITGPCVVFSNELFDAQPFRRFIARGGRWRELGVGLRNGQLEEVELETEIPRALPPAVPEGYHIDAPFAAATLAKELTASPWRGLFVAFDYGKSWSELTEATPVGTARAYSRHQQSNDLLSQPGHQDLTCHVCWDWIADSLTTNGFSTPHLQSQESFFVHHAGRFIAEATAADAARFSQRKLSLLQLLHPSHLGQKFQVMHGWRG